MLCEDVFPVVEVECVLAAFHEDHLRQVDLVPSDDLVLGRAQWEGKPRLKAFNFF